MNLILNLKGKEINFLNLNNTNTAFFTKQLRDINQSKDNRFNSILMAVMVASILTFSVSIISKKRVCLISTFFISSILFFFVFSDYSGKNENFLDMFIALFKIKTVNFSSKTALLLGFTMAVFLLIMFPREIVDFMIKPALLFASLFILYELLFKNIENPVQNSSNLPSVQKPQEYSLFNHAFLVFIFSSFSFFILRTLHFEISAPYFMDYFLIFIAFFLLSKFFLKDLDTNLDNKLFFVMIKNIILFLIKGKMSEEDIEKSVKSPLMYVILFGMYFLLFKFTKIVFAILFSFIIFLLSNFITFLFLSKYQIPSPTI